MAADRNLIESSAEVRRALREELLDLLHSKNIRSVYQPIVSLSDGEVLGYEALTRGPERSALHSPLSLFELAEQEGLLYPLDRLARSNAIGSVTLRSGKQQLFLNLSADILNDPLFAPGQTLELLRLRGLTPANVVFEITERSSIEDFEKTKHILDHYRKQGYRIAIDDAGAGYSSLQAIAELHPDYIKVDRSLVSGVHRNKTKEYILETMVTFAEKLGVYLIAEGIETEEELTKLTLMGVHYGQGFLLGRPDKEPADLTPELRQHIVSHRKKLEMSGHVLSIGELSSPSPTFDAQTPISTVANYFKEHVNAQGVVVTTGSEPVGLIMRDRLFQQLAGQYGYSLFWNRPIDSIMDVRPLIVEEHTPVEWVSRLATSRDIRNLYDLVIVTSKGCMLGTASIRTILECMTNVKMENAKVASPLTGLPGNLQINRELNRRLTEGRHFSVIYADLDYFKWFNDRYGFHQGDQLIQFTADCIQQAIHLAGIPDDFVGHIGGDDFIAMSGTSNPELLCTDILQRFDRGVRAFYEVDNWSYVEDRHGNRMESGGVTLSLALVVCKSGLGVTPEQISQVSARLKKLSKAYRGSVYYCDCIGSEATAPAADPQPAHQGNKSSI
ncbi:bifunctional diguanylate cyclase/phosphodiesterase [Paenibacillus sp. tmac-D7]|uniref:GGDEF domain-containing protein n=1 Tax=Paenibacillus sp. tmac-D7 TaxID=2591462 RepID=UPI0015E861D7|nr:bifunctional diguanylate cyclase/phosphodiesterase [Paenibacillus sp. tmac-D7]